MILEPVENVLALDLPVLPEARGDALDLVGIGRAEAAIVVEIPEDADLVAGGDPARARLPAEKAGTSLATAMASFLLLLAMLHVVMVGIRIRIRIRIHGWS